MVTSKTAKQVGMRMRLVNWWLGFAVCVAAAPAAAISLAEERSPLVPGKAFERLWGVPDERILF